MNAKNAQRGLFDLLLQIIKKLGGKELPNRDLQPVANFLDGRDGGGGVPSADDVVQGGLRDPANGGQLIQGDVVCLAQFYDPQSDRFVNSHRALLTQVG